MLQSLYSRTTLLFDHIKPTNLSVPAVHMLTETSNGIINTMLHMYQHNDAPNGIAYVNDYILLP